LVDRTIKKEPAYKGKPEYALLVFGPEARSRVLVVRDGDTLYADKNGNGDLTDAGERIGGKKGQVGRSGVYCERTLFLVGGITGARGEALGFSYEYYQDRTVGDFFHLYENFKAKDDNVSGTHVQGLPGEGPVEFLFGKSPRDCPVAWFQGPLAVRDITQDPFRPGTEGQVMIRLGTPGVLKGSFAAVTTDAVPKDVHPVAEIEFPGRQPDAPPVRLRVTLTKRC
jgi:hypothetical protein